MGNKAGKGSLKGQAVIKFMLLCVVLFGYFGYISYRFDVVTGGAASLLTWSFFVLCTPIADAGFLLDFPLRLLFGIRMIYSEMVVWAIAILLNVFTLNFAVEFYETTLLTKLLHQILTTPFPYWAVIFISACGTFLSIRFGDELLDVAHHKDRHFFHAHHFKHELLLGAFFIIALVVYYQLIVPLGLEAAL